MTLNYRIGTLIDEEKLRKLGLTSYGVFKEVLTADNWAVMHSFLSASNAYSDLLLKATCFVCEADGELVGMAFLLPHGNPTEIFDTQWSYIRMVGVNPAFRGNGIGKKLTRLCVDLAKETNESVVALHTSEFMHPAMYIYEGIGFEKVRELAPLYGNQYWLYKLQLADWSTNNFK
ncbi:MAG: GNAT family N-acetyltransferase [Flavobacteriales bacterium]|nr:GNAT family N-acetyltransferase [Flavobacteriales bacterium]